VSAPRSSIAAAARRFPELANLLTHTPGLSLVAKLVAGIGRRRPLPRFAPMTLQEWFARLGGTANPAGRPVVLFPDTFNNHFNTGVGVACVEAIEAAGWQVVTPEGHLCCGRPSYDYGFLDAAERHLHRVLDVLRPRVRAGTPIVGMEPSCLAVLQDELTELLPHDDDARRLTRNAYHFPESFRTFGIRPPSLKGRALLWGHCRRRATGGMSPEQELLEQMGLDVENVQGGCCSLAGVLEVRVRQAPDLHALRRAALLPAVRDAAEDCLVVADGFSCKTQIEDAGTGRRALHVAEVMKPAREEGAHAVSRFPERGTAPRARPPPRKRALRIAAAVAAGATPTAAGMRTMRS
jgi:Fe-S oxidoreductase